MVVGLKQVVPGQMGPQSRRKSPKFLLLLADHRLDQGLDGIPAHGRMVGPREIGGNPPEPGGEPRGPLLPSST